MRAYRLIGWQNRIDPRRRNDRNMDTAKLFSSRELAEQYAKDTGFKILRITEVSREDGDPSVDLVLRV